MPLISVILNPGDSGANVGELHNQLSELGAVINPGEQTATSFGPATAAAVNAFRAQYNLPAGNTVDAATAAVLNVASTFAGPGGRAALSAAVSEAAAALDNSQQQALAVLDRHAVIAQNYPLAKSIAQRITDLSGVRAVIDPIIEPPGQQPRPPELPYPENFYTYRRDLYPPNTLKEIKRQVVGDPPRDPHQADGPAGFGSEYIRAAASWFEAIIQWQTGNAALDHREFALAQAAYDACQAAACDYFATYHNIDLGSGTVFDRLSNVMKNLWQHKDLWSSLWSSIVWRRGLLTLEELGDWDFPQQPTHTSNLLIPRSHDPSSFVGTLPPPPDYGLGFIQYYLQVDGDPNIAHRIAVRQSVLEAPLVTIAFVLVPLARAEANRARRQYDAAISDLRWVLDSVHVQTMHLPPPNPPSPIFVRARLACEFIELPFANLLLAETMLDKADAEYKAGIPAEPPPAPDVSTFQGLKAAQTYLALKDHFANEGQYVALVEESRNLLDQQIQQRLSANDTSSWEFQLLGKDILVRTYMSASRSLPGLDRRTKADEPLLMFKLLQDQPVMRETNPRVYAAIMTATAKLEQLKAGFNYLGYLDSYVPPWRFQFLLDRTRYFAEHAKNAQRDYLNFLNNAEHEALQALSAAQNVELEKSNIRIETARVDQVQLEVAAAQQSKDLADLTAADANARLLAYKEFDKRADDLAGTGESADLLTGYLRNFTPAGLFGQAVGGSVGEVVNDIGTNTLDFFTGGAASRAIDRAIAAEQREYEKYSLGLAAKEAAKAAEVSKAQLATAQAGLLVAGLQRQAALLRHEYAVQNLDYLRNQVLNAEQWYRLADSIRSIGDTYLHYAIQLAFLTQQAYEFEADKPLNVIRFDYDLSAVGAELAADFLLRDLDSLENDLIVTQRVRQQPVRYVLSMAREFPEALQEIRDTGKATFSLRLEQLEQRFPGLYNLRIGAVDVLPVALMDSTRFSLELTHLGTSLVRLKAQPDTPPGTPSSSPLNTNDLTVPVGGWLAELQETWPVKLRVTGPETAVFSGLSRQDASAVFPLATTGQRQAFEALGAAAAWKVDLTARANQVVPGSLADLLITFTLSGYHDSELRAAIDAVKPQTSVQTSFLSAQQIFPDAFYDFIRTGRMVWKVRRELLTLSGDLGRLRNIGFSLRPGAPDVHFSRLMTRLQMNFRVDASSGVASGVTVFTTIPETSVTQTAPLTVAVRAALSTASELAWDFGDGTPVVRTVRSGTTPIAPAEGAHTYAKPGRYIMKLRCVQNDALSEFRVSVLVSRNQHLGDPLIIFLPSVTFDATAKTITMITGGAVQQAGRMLWRVGDTTAEGDSATFTLKPGNYTLDFGAVRKLNFRAYGAQRYVNGATPLPLRGLNATTNRTFDPNGAETNGTGTPPLPIRNEMANRLFDTGEISPEDDWAFELIPEEILGLPTGTTVGTEVLDLSEIQDVVLSMEYDITSGGS